MGATQSKKRWKDMQKKKRGSISSDNTIVPPRSLSMDVLHSTGITASPSATCPLCPHCRLTVSWSSDHALTHSLCLHHDKQRFGGGEGNVLTKDTFQSCPDCLQIKTTSKLLSSSLCSSQPYHHQRLCEISNQDYDEMSTMSLNRNIPGGYNMGDFNSSNKMGGIVQSKSAEFSDHIRVTGSSRMGQCSQTKENVNPSIYNSSVNESENLSTSRRRKTGNVDDINIRTPSTDRQRSTSTEMSIRQRFTNINTSNSSSTTHSSTFVDNSHRNKETKSNLSLLEDEEMVMSQWIRRKQMAQELRKLRMHLQREEDTKHQTNLSFSQNSFGSKPYPFHNESTKQDKDNIVNESFTSTTNQTVMEVSHSNFATSKDERSSSSTHFSANSTTAKDTTNSTTSSFTTATSPSRRSLRSKFSKLSNYRYLDNHPVMTRLQNEQNNRLEMMERRMEEIRISAMQEAERRRFAEIFPAKDKDSETQKLMREARESLERMKEEKRMKNLSTKDQQQQCQHQHRHQNQFIRASSAPPRSDFEKHTDAHSHEDAGEIIPVIHVLSSSRGSTPVIGRDNRSQKKTNSLSDKNNRNNKKSLWGQGEWPDINLGKPLTWLWLPFMLFPLVLRMLLSMLFTSMTTPTTPRNSNSVSSTALSYPDQNRNVQRDKRKKSC